MSFNYDKIKGKEGSSDQWASYSDLFMVLSFVFLLLYVVSSLRNGTFSIQKSIQQQNLAEELAALKQQIKVYDTLKEDYMEKKASNEEQAVYNELMDKLSLLKDEAKEEKDDLRRQALENEKKELALNKYQQMIRNIINTNLIAQSRIKKRDKIITKKQKALYKRQKEINKLNEVIQDKKEIISDNNLKMANINNNFELKVAELRESQKKHKTSKKKLNTQIAKLKDKSKKQIKKLDRFNKEIKNQLGSVSGKLASAKDQLDSAQKKILKQSKEKKSLSNELLSAASRLKEANLKHQQSVEKLKDQHQGKAEREKNAFEKKLKRAKLSAKEKERKIAQFQQEASNKESKFKNKISQLNSKYYKSKERLAQAEQKNVKISSSLKKAQELANKRRKLAMKIKRNLSKEGIDAKINMKTGDVELSFGDDYFETGQSFLKSTMKQRIEKFIPIYASSLFNDDKIAKNIKSVEIVGYASPTYRGKFVDPKSLSIKDRKAVSFNLDLSYKRAKSIFKHIFNTNKMKFHHQQKLLSQIKVTGRSFLAEEIKGRSISSGLGQKEYCKQFDCKKSQRVIIKFNLKN